MDFAEELFTAISEELGRRPLAVDVLAERLHEREDLAFLSKFSTNELADMIRHELVLLGDQFWLTDTDMVVELDVMLDGIHLTHWATPFELEHEVLMASPDLILIDCDADDDVPLAGGGELELLYDGELGIAGENDEDGEPIFFYTGDPHWLRDIDQPSLVMLSRHDGVISVGPGELEADGTREADAMRQVFDEWSVSGGPLDIHELLLEVLARDPTLFRSPVPPITDLFASIELVADGDDVYEVGAEPGDEEESSLDDIGERFGFDPCCESAFAAVLVSVLRATGAIEPDDEETSTDETQHWRLTLKHLAHENVAPALADTILDTSDESSPVLDALLQRLHAYGLESAQTHYLQALNLERDGEVLAARQELEIATRLDPWYRPALEELAWYVSDSGDLRRADGLYARAQVDEDDPQRSYLLDLLSPPLRGVGRNDPCPCGSGRKYKLCCLNGGTWPIARRVGLLYQKIRAFTLRPQNRYLAEPIFASLMDDPSDSYDGTTLTLLLDLVSLSDEALERFIDARGVILPADERHLVQEWIGIGPSCWQILEVDPGTSITMLDTMTGVSHVVAEKSMSREVRAGDYVYAHVVPDGTGFQIIGMVLRLSAIQRETLASALRAGGEPERLATWVRTLTIPAMMRTSDGERIVICQSVLVPRTSTWQEIAMVLDDMFDRREEGQRWADIDHNTIDGVIRGELERRDDRLVVTTNAVEREERILGMLRFAIDDLEIVETTHRDLEEAKQLLEDAKNVPSSPVGRRSLSDDEIDSSEMQAALETFIRQREIAWLDESIPALHGLTPRQAAQDPTRREELVALLNEFDYNPTVGPNAATFNADRLRSLLGMERDD
jgi:hypothetical protein